MATSGGTMDTERRTRTEQSRGGEKVLEGGGSERGTGMSIILGNVTGYEVGDRVTAPCEKNTSGGVGAATDGIVWLPDLSLEGKVNTRRK